MPDWIAELSNDPVTLLSLIVSAAAVGAGVVFAITSPRLLLLVIKNLRRNVVRTGLTCLATMVLVFMVTMIWTVIFFLDQQTTEKAKDFKLIITERWQLPSQMPLPHARYLDPERPECIFDPKKFGIGPKDFMTWSFYGGFADATKTTRENLVFFFVMNPKHILPMMEDMETLDPALVEKLAANPKGCLMGPERMKMLNKRVGEGFKIKSINYKGIDLEFEIVGALPEGRHAMSSIMNDSYFNNELDRYFQINGQKHPMDQKRLNLVWLRVRDQETFNKLGEVIENSPYLTNPQVKVETMSSGIGNFLDAYRDLLWGMKWLMVPAILASMALVVANAISISVRERRTEMAVLKVLGFRPRQILSLVLGESVLVGGASGLASAALTYAIINFGMGGIPFPVGFFPAFLIPGWALAWGLAMGCGTSLLGSFLPAWTARQVKVSEVFAKVA